MSTPDFVRLDGGVHVNPKHIVSIVAAPQLSNAIRFDVRMANGETHPWAFPKGEDVEKALARLMALINRN